MLQIEIISPCGKKAYTLQNGFLTDDRLAQHCISIEVSRGDNRGEGMTVSGEEFFNLIDNLFKERF